MTSLVGLISVCESDVTLQYNCLSYQKVIFEISANPIYNVMQYMYHCHSNQSREVYFQRDLDDRHHSKPKDSCNILCKRDNMTLRSAIYPQTLIKEIKSTDCFLYCKAYSRQQHHLIVAFQISFLSFNCWRQLI